MSRKAAIVEEFDDDTDLPLPSMPLPHTGSHGPILQGINDEPDDEEDDLDLPHRAGPASPPRQPFSKSPPDTEGNQRVTDITPYKSYVLISCFWAIIVIVFLWIAGPASILSTSMQNARTEQGKDEYHAIKVYGGRRAKILPMQRLG